MFNIQKAFEEISRGDADALKFLSACYVFFHTRDDLVDRDNPVAPAQVVLADLRFMEAVSVNPFYQKNSTFLWPLFIMAGLAYEASENFKRREDVVDRIVSQVLKSQYVDIFLGVAFLTGGFDHAVEMGKRYRDYHFDNEFAPKVA